MPLFSLAIDLSWNEEEERFLPFLYIVDISKNPLYIYKTANEETLKSVSKTLSKKEESLMALIHDLKKDSILKKLTKNKKITSLKQLKEDKTLKAILQDYLNRKLNALINITQKSEIPISINLNNRKDFYLNQVHFLDSVIKPQLHFSKNEEGINYTLSLLHKNEKTHPSECELIIINQFPCWVVINKQLIQITDIDSLKLKPFLKNKSIHIPKRMENEYFKKFINDIIKKVAIETEGFSVITKNEISGYSLKGSHDFLGKKYLLQIEFDYQGISFTSNQSKNQHSFIEFDNNETVSVIQYKRDFSKETIIEEKLISLGLEKNRDGNFYAPDQTDELASIEFVLEHLEALQSEGFNLENFQIDHKKIQLKKSTISLQSSEQADWFDLKMTIFCGNHQFPFSDIIPNIKNGNQWFLLPDDTYFIIPSMWMKTYGNIAQFGTKKTNGGISLPKSHYLNLNLNSVQLENETEAKQTLIYKPSPLLKATLRPYQIQGAQWLLNHYANGLGACLADDMGLGKTLQTLALLIAVQENEKNLAEPSSSEMDLFSLSQESQQEPLKTLVVVPSSLVFNWYNETKKFTPHFKCIKYIGNDRKVLAKKLTRYDVVFTSFAVLNRDISQLEKMPFRYLIVDESQQIKNRNSKIFKALNSLQAENKISLSGTPIENSLADLWSQMQFINPSILGEYAFFDQYFKKPIEKEKDESKIEELKNIINPYILRRTKNEVLKDLPELVEQVIVCEMNEEQEKHYEEEKSKARNYLLKLEESPSPIHILNVLLKLRQWSNHPRLAEKQSVFTSGKFDSVSSYLETLVKSKSKTLIFSSFVSHLELYEDWCRQNNISFCSLTGNTSSEERENSVRQFQTDNDTLFFFISLKAGGVGLNLTKASYIILLDPWWNPFAEKQAIARAHRIGQENKVNVIRFITQNTIEEKIIQLQEKKKELSESIIDESSIPENVMENLDFLLE
ncbi:DEAD/DEAH box helicase [Flavobacterium sp. H122]|uniref:DEAD/DEAH box helicase n=1 Tax=Flavobacterium sp. H122 TaxID=2529860 RepID=UPI0010A9FCB8|nr:SNF2-related protein [Flavobacterium sp. H122]